MLCVIDVTKRCDAWRGTPPPPNLFLPPELSWTSYVSWDVFHRAARRR